MLWFKKTKVLQLNCFPGAKVRICSETILGGVFGTKASPFLYGIFFAIRMAKV
jgi:hypothetical protein